jgi:hypothetical protein
MKFEVDGTAYQVNASINLRVSNGTYFVEAALTDGHAPTPIAIRSFVLHCGDNFYPMSPSKREDDVAMIDFPVACDEDEGPISDIGATFVYGNPD